MALRWSPLESSASPLVTALRHGLQLKGNSLLMTLFGDAIAPRNQPVWLGTLIQLAGQLGLSSRLVRTSVYRLMADDWLVASREGRRSYYRLSASGARRVEHARRRIYSPRAVAPETPHWTLLMVSSALRASARQQLQRELLWNGYGEIADGVYAHTEADPASLQDILLANQATHHVCVLQAQGDRSMATRPLHALRNDCCCVQRLELAWQRFTERFAPAQAAASALCEHEAFLVRTLLVHEYRRILQRQPILPHALESPEMVHRQAHQLFVKLYGQLHPRSERFLDQALTGAVVPAQADATPAPARTALRRLSPTGALTLH